MKDVKKVAAAEARAESLSPERRKEIAQKAAKSRWGRAAISNEGILPLGGVELQCFVLDDETRVLSRASFVRAIGRKGKVKGGRQYDHDLALPPFLTAKNLQPYLPADISETAQPIPFAYGDAEMIGYRAEFLADVCDIFDDAQRAGALLSNQIHIAEACRILSRGLTRVGIIGLVDEATGYQDIRARNALNQVLEKFIAKELRKWVQTFPNEFYHEMFRLRNWEWKEEAVRKTPGVVGKYTNNLVYERLAPGVLDELRSKNPKLPSGRRRHKHFQWLTEDVGNPRLREHLASVVTLMRASTNWEQFLMMMDRALPRYGATLELPLND